MTFEELYNADFEITAPDVALQSWNDSHSYTGYRHSGRPYDGLMLITSDIRMEFSMVGGGTVTAEKNDLIYLPMGLLYTVRIESGAAGSCAHSRYSVQLYPPGSKRTGGFPVRYAAAHQPRRRTLRKILSGSFRGLPRAETFHALYQGGGLSPAAACAFLLSWRIGEALSHPGRIRLSEAPLG